MKPLRPDGVTLPATGASIRPLAAAVLWWLLSAGLAYSGHWAFAPLERPVPPEVRDKAWVQNPIDAFILRNLEAEGLRPAPPADKAALIRRVYYDLTGLPPTLEQVEQFVADDSPVGLMRLVDRLLASPHYGERWGRHWLDWVRYGESNSFERDAPKPFAWRYRDYVIASFNQDKPYDRFVLEQLAGDELAARTPESVIATGYYRLGIWDDEPTDPLQARYDELDDILATTSQVFLGLTMNCSRCHDHKQDPIPQVDYYRFLAFLANVRSTEKNPESILSEIATEEDRAAGDGEQAARQEQIHALAEDVARFESRILQAAQGEGATEETDPERRARLLSAYQIRVLGPDEVRAYENARSHLAKLREAQPPAWPQALTVKEYGREAPETFVLVRGNAHSRGIRVAPGFPAVLGFEDPVLPDAPAGTHSSGRRRVLAEWIASPRNPLTARVMANRIWQHHFGRGITTSPNNFGMAGDPPTHPELLDWLACEFIERGWSMKGLHRLIMGSSAYQMSAQAREAGWEKDPDNALFGRMNLRRLSAEEIRDSILMLNGRLNRSLGGPSVYPELSEEVLATQSRPGHGWGQSSDSEQARRSVYIHVKRSLLVPFLTAFDWPDPDLSCPERFTTTQPTQALTLLNSAFANREAAHFARWLRDHGGSTVEDQVRVALGRALSRKPTSLETERGVRLIQHLEQVEGLDAEIALAQFCLAIYNLNEFVYLD